MPGYEMMTTDRGSSTCTRKNFVSNWPHAPEISSLHVDVTFFFGFIVDLKETYNEWTTSFC
jgi:hypothetical protein